MQGYDIMTSMIDHFYEKSHNYAGNRLAVSADEAKSIKKLLGYVLEVKKNSEFPDRPYSITRKMGKKFKAEHLLPWAIEELEREREQNDKIYSIYHQMRTAFGD